MKMKPKRCCPPRLCWDFTEWLHGTGVQCLPGVDIGVLCNDHSDTYSLNVVYFSFQKKFSHSCGAVTGAGCPKVVSPLWGSSSLSSVCPGWKKEHMHSVGDMGIAPESFGNHSRSLLTCSAQQCWTLLAFHTSGGGEFGNEDFGIFPTAQLTRRISGTVSTVNVSISTVVLKLSLSL